ncbi:hypothetical protein N0B31_18110 [Salinirubellus salinus]|jgi:hypothetical protein|uniref:DUF7511 domain-containing protein n=1 Tax=Salinirubellus salinus TaxID=1364945 RepID=A0A9E7R3C0_9EURY|nr:hypothetical protein [Salinirubellus salinus]UWM54023.1 hypothetical protein N0B31_18110 [Salinirubellus salinus]
MSTAATGDDWERTDGSALTEDGLVARVVHYESGDELTLFPAAADDVSLMSRWLTADEGSWVELDEMR